MRFSYLLLFWFYLLFFTTVNGQIEPIIDKLQEARIKAHGKDSAELKKIFDVLKFYRFYEKEVEQIKGNAAFGFSGSESNNSSNYDINTNVSLSHGVFPFEKSLSTNFLTNLTNGVFSENISNVDVSFDFHPINYSRKIKKRDIRLKKLGNKVIRANDKYRNAFKKKLPTRDSLLMKFEAIKNKYYNREKKFDQKEVDALWLETFAFLKRFNNSFLGIDQRYEAGAGIIFNFFSKNQLTIKGTQKNTKLSKLPYYSYQETQFWPLLIKLTNQKDTLVSILKNRINSDLTLNDVHGLIDTLHSLQGDLIIKIKFEDVVISKVIVLKGELAARKMLNNRFSKLIDSIEVHKNSLLKDLQKLEGDNGNLVKCLQLACKKLNKSINQLNKNDIDYLSSIKHRYRNQNIKTYSRWRIGLLLGAFYELEKAQAFGKLEMDDLLFFKDLTLSPDVTFPFSIDTLNSSFSLSDFRSTAIPRWEIRPTIEWSPDEIFKFKFKPYFKLPFKDGNKIANVVLLDTLGQVTELTSLDKQSNVRKTIEEELDKDIFFDWEASIQATLNTVSITFTYNYFKDFAPKSAYITDDNGELRSLIGQKIYHNFMFKLGFKF